MNFVIHLCGVSGRLCDCRRRARRARTPDRGPRPGARVVPGVPAGCRLPEAGLCSVSLVIERVDTKLTHKVLEHTSRTQSQTSNKTSTVYSDPSHQDTHRLGRSIPGVPGYGALGGHCGGAVQEQSPVSLQCVALEPRLPSRPKAAPQGLATHHPAPAATAHGITSASAS